MDKYELAMAKYSKELTNKAVNKLNGFYKFMYELKAIKVYDITIFRAVYKEAQIVRFTYNWINPLSWVFALFMLCNHIKDDIAKCYEKAHEDIKQSFTILLQ